LQSHLGSECYLYLQARKTGNWNNFRHFQKECKRAFRRAEWKYVNEFIQEGLENNNTKPFWRYVKSRKQDKIGVSPLKSNGQLLSDGKSKAEAHFSGVFMRNNSETPVLKTNRHHIGDITITGRVYTSYYLTLRLVKHQGRTPYLTES
jgi:hypothetical protein